jgi:hypothetical protein
MAKRDERKNNAFSVAEWAKSAQPRRTGRPCSTCKSAAVVEAVKQVLTVMLEERCNISIAQIHEMLQKKFRYRHTYGALKHHVYTCEQEIWSKINGTS